MFNNINTNTNTNANTNTNINNELNNINDLFSYLRQQQSFYSNLSHNQHIITTNLINLINNTMNPNGIQNNYNSAFRPFIWRNQQQQNNNNNQPNNNIWRRDAIRPPPVRTGTQGRWVGRGRNFRQSPIRFPRRDTTVNTNLPNLQNFINNTLFSSNRTIFRPTIRNIINQVSIHIWCNIKNNININQESCPIAVRAFNDNDIVAKINHCNHCFLYEKLLEWFDNDTRCPVCRYNIASLITPIDISSNTQLNIPSLNNIDLSNNSTQTDLSNNLIAEFSFNIPPNLNLSHLFRSEEPPTAFDEADEAGV